MRLGEVIVLLAEDNEDEVVLFRRALKKAVPTPLRIETVGSGVECLKYLQGQDRFRDRATFPFPNILILDSKMPGLGGLEVLEWLRAHEEYSIVPTVILSSSSQPNEVDKAYRLGANAYFTKPMNHGETEILLAAFFRYWQRCEIPTQPRQCGLASEATSRHTAAANPL